MLIFFWVSVHGYSCVKGSIKAIIAFIACFIVASIIKYVTLETPFPGVALLPWLGSTRSDRVKVPVRFGTGSKNSLRYLGWQMGAQIKSNLQIQKQDWLNIKLDFIPSTCNHLVVYIRLQRRIPATMITEPNTCEILVSDIVTYLLNLVKLIAD